MADFTELPVLRGMTEIIPVFEMLTPGEHFVLGGYVRYMCSPRRSPHRAQDLDIYSINEEAFNSLLSVLKAQGLEVKHENEVSVTFKVPEAGKFMHCPVIQLIKPVKKGAIVASGDLQTILASFDFTVVRIGLLSSKTALADVAFEADEKARHLCLRNIHCPISSTLRCMKYARKGYFLRPTEALKLFNDWERRDDTYRTELYEMLTKKDLTKEEVEHLEWLLRID